MDLAHDLAPEGQGGVAGVGDALVVLVAGPDRRGVVGGVAREVAVIVGAGGTGLAGDGHVAEVGGGAGAAAHRALEELVHEVGGALLHGDVGLGLVFQDDVAIGVRDPGVEPGGVIDAAVGEGREGRRHLLGGNAPAEAAQGQGAGGAAVLLRQGGDAHVLRHELVGLVQAQLQNGPDGHGVQGLGHAVLQGDHARVPRGGVLGPGGAVEQLDGVVIKAVRHGDGPVLQRRGVGGNGLDGGAALMDVRRVVPHHVALLLAHVAHHGHHVAVGDIHDGDAGADQLAAGGGQVLEVAPVGVNGLGDGLDVRVHGGIDTVAAGEELGLGSLLVQAPKLHEVRGHVPADLIHEVGLVLLVLIVLLQRLIGVAFPFDEVQLLVDGGLVLRLRLDVALLIHQLQDGLLTLLVQLPGGNGGAVVPGVGDLVHGAVEGGVVGDGDDAGALRRAELPDVLIEVVLGRGLHAVAALAEVDIVEVELQDLRLGVLLLKLQRPEDLPDLAVDVGLVVLGHVLQGLLGDGGAAIGVALFEKHVDGGADGALPVHAVVFKEAFVLHGHGGLPHGVRELVIVHQDAVLLRLQGLQLHILPGVLVRVVDDGGLGHVVVVDVHIQGGGQGGLHIGQEDPGEHGAGDDTDEEDGPDNETGAPLPALVPPPLLGRTGLLPMGAGLAASFVPFVLQSLAPPCIVSPRQGARVVVSLSAALRRGGGTADGWSCYSIMTTIVPWPVNPEKPDFSARKCVIPRISGGIPRFPPGVLPDFPHFAPAGDLLFRRKAVKIPLRN